MSRSSNERYTTSTDHAADATNGSTQTSDAPIDDTLSRSSKTPSAICSLQTAFPLLHAIVGNGHRAQRHAPMTKTGRNKYYTVLTELTDDQLHAHLLGQATYAVPLIGTDELASAGLIEQDTGGMDMARRILAAAEARGVTMFAIVIKGSGGHDGCHPWALYDGRYDPKAIRAQLRQIAEDAGAAIDEIHPNNTNIRLPFGLHLRSETRGQLILQSGEIYHLDDSDQLSMGEAAVALLPLNAQPPSLPANLPEAKPVATFQIHKSSGRASLADVKARFNAEHDWPELLDAKGGVEHREGWACNCGFAHTHAIQIAITSQDKIVSYSPNCRWAPHRDSGKALDKFGFYVAQWHGNDVVAALKTLNPIQPRIKLDIVNLDPPTRYTDEQRAEWRARKNVANAAEAAQIRVAVEAHAATDDQMTPCDRATVREMLGWAAAHNSSACWLGRASLARLTGYSLGSIKRSVMHLEALGYFESEGKGGRTIDTARRNFSRGSLFATQTICVPKDDPRIVYIASDHDQTLGACERPPLPQAESVYAPVVGRPANMALVEQLSAMDDAEFAAWFASHGQRPAQQAAVEPEADTEMTENGAKYEPGRDWTAGGVFDLTDWRDPVEIRMRETPIDADEATQLELPEDEPQVRCAPVEPEAANKYWALRGKAAKKTTSPAQRRALDGLADALMIWLPAREAAEARARAAAVAYAARSPARARRAPTVAQEVLYGIP